MLELIYLLIGLVLGFCLGQIYYRYRRCRYKGMSRGQAVIAATTGGGGGPHEP